MSKRTILIRADSSKEIGWGHIMRDLALAAYYRDATIYFATLPLEGNINQKIVQAGYQIIDLKDNTLETLIDVIATYHIDEVIIDHYGIDKAFEKKLKRATGVHLMVLDDAYQKHYCDVLLNHNVYAKRSRYKGLVPKSCKLLCGASYTLIRPEFKELEPRTPNAEIKRVIVSMGGADSANVTMQILPLLEKFDWDVDVVVASSNPYLSEIDTFTKERLRFVMHVDTSSMAQLINDSDLAIVPASVTVHEVLFLKRPFIAIQTAENQKELAKYLRKNGFAVLCSFDAQQLEERLEEFVRPRLVNFIDTTKQERKMILKWRNKKKIRQWMFTQHKISWKEHLSFIEGLVSDERRHYFLVYYRQEALGSINVQELDGGVVTLGLYQNPNLHGYGEMLLARLIAYGFEELHAQRLRVEAFADNERAITLYEHFGFFFVEEMTVGGQKVVVLELKHEN